MRAAAAEMLREAFRIDRFPPTRIQAIDLVAERLRDREPALGKCPASRYENAPLHAILERCLHDARPRGGDDERVRGRFEERLQVAADAAEQLAKLGRAVADHRPRHLRENRGTHPGRAGDEELAFNAHVKAPRTSSKVIANTSA